MTRWVKSDDAPAGPFFQSAMMHAPPRRISPNQIGGAAAVSDGAGAEEDGMSVYDKVDNDEEEGTQT